MVESFGYFMEEFRIFLSQFISILSAVGQTFVLLFRWAVFGEEFILPQAQADIGLFTYPILGVYRFAFGVAEPTEAAIVNCGVIGLIIGAFFVVRFATMPLVVLNLNPQNFILKFFDRVVAFLFCIAGGFYFSAIGVIPESTPALVWLVIACYGVSFYRTAVDTGSGFLAGCIGYVAERWDVSRGRFEHLKPKEAGAPELNNKSL